MRICLIQPPEGSACLTLPRPLLSLGRDVSVTKAIVDIDHLQLRIDISLAIVFSGHHTPLFFSAFSASRAPVAHWDADGRGSSRYISWYQASGIRLTFTTCYVRHHIALWDIRSIGQL